MFKVRLWGVRGSIPCPGPDTVTYGGNTICLELRVGEEDRLLIIDAGSGIRALSNYLVANDLPQGPIQTQIFLTHTHWDHIIGFPFFTPIYIPGTKLEIYGPVSYEDESLEEILGGQLRYRYFPVRQSELAAEISYHPLKEAVRDLGDGLMLRTKYLNHPILDLGYRFEYQGKVFVTVFDNEPFRNVFDVPKDSPDYDADAFEEGEAAAREENEKVLRFMEGADLCIYDAQYTQKEYDDSKVGWGHSSFEWAINSAYKARVGKIVLIHHDPLRTDAELEQLETGYRASIERATQAAASGPSSSGGDGGRALPDVMMAREGMELQL